MRRHTDSADEVERFDDATCVRETDKAILVKQDDLGEVWIPRSQVHDDSEVYEEGGEGELVVKAWFARKQGWA
jgi:hypothetical protein